MNNQILDLLRECSVKILVGNKTTTAGSGFFIAPGMVLTCTHVVESQLANDSPAIHVVWKNHQYLAQIIKAFPKPFPDTALLGLDALIEHPCVMVNHNISVGDQIAGYGFSDEYPEGDSVLLVYEGPTTISSETETQEQYLLKMQSGQVRPGLSGGPLLNMRSGCVCGIIKSTRDLSIDLGGRGIPLSVVLPKLPYLNTQQLLFHQQNLTWLNRLSVEQKLLINSADDKKEIRTRTHEVEKIELVLTQQLEKLYSRYVSGSSRITIGNLLNADTDLFIKFRWRPAKTNEPEKEDIAKYIMSTIPIGGDVVGNYYKKTLVLSDPGFGKSTLTYILFGKLVDNFIKKESSYVPVYINLQDYIGDQDFGTKEWTLELLNQFTQLENVSWAGIQEVGRLPKMVPYFILDALDEYLSGFTLNEINRVLKKYIFTVASVMTCRRQYFERYLFMSDFAQNFEKLYLLNWTKTDTTKYTNNYYRYCFTKDEAEMLASKAQKTIEKSPHLRELCQVPLRLNMTLELLSDTTTEPDTIVDINSLYYTYVFNWLARESSKVNSVLSVDDKYQALKVLAWHFYDEGKVGQNYQSNKFTRSEIKKVISGHEEDFEFVRKIETDKIVEDLATRSILLEEEGLNYGVESRIIRFAHKSFLEYLVASHLNDAILNSHQIMRESFSRIISQEVAQFLKGYIARINQDQNLLSRAVSNSVNAITINQDDTSLRPEQRKITASQMSYYMGHINSPKIFDFLSRNLGRETDLLLKRSIVIGLSFSGHKEYLNQYIDRLRATREAQAENEINIGAQLSYFGDQPYDDLNPGDDQLIPSCKHTIEKLIYQLGTEINRGSWRLDLFTILDIGKFRPISRKDFIETMKEKLDDFRSIIESYKNDPSCRDWPEISEAEQLIAFLDEMDDNTVKFL